MAVERCQDRCNPIGEIAMEFSFLFLLIRTRNIHSVKDINSFDRKNFYLPLFFSLLFLLH